MSAQKRKNKEQSSSKKKRFDFRYLGAYFENNPSSVDDVASVQIGGNSSNEGKANSNVVTYHRRGGIEEEAPDSDGETQAEKNGEDGNNAPSFAPLFEEKMHYIHKLERFALSRHITEFVLNANYHEHQGDQQFVTASDETLNATFEQLIDQAIKNAEQQSDGRRVSKIGIVLDGKGLNDPIVLPLRPPIQNNAHVLMMELEKIGQSDGDDQVHGGGMNKRSLLLSEAVQISITCLAPPVGSAPRFYPHQHWGYNEKQLIRIRNEDNFCLFHALVAARAFHDHELHMEQTKHKQTTMLTGQQLVNMTIQRKSTLHVSKTSKTFCSNYEAFNRLLSNTQIMNKTVAELITAAEIPTNLEAYGLEHIKSVQDYWDKSTPGLYRIVLFEHAPAELPRPLWKGPPGRRFNVTLFLQEGHYNAIKRINSFFNLGRKYCIDCECSYGNDRKHTVNCKARCPQCGRVGHQHPCSKEEGVNIYCIKCNRNFFSQRCFDSHIGQTCTLLKKCGKCQRVYHTDRGQKHKCFTSYCPKCKVHHEKKKGCFIQQVVIPNKKHKYRIVVYDTETRLETLKEGQQRHKVNYLSARVTCTECCDSLATEIFNCEICTNNTGLLERSKDWSEADGDDPIANFVEWILRAWDKKYKTYLWAHNASRFDGHFVLKYLGETKRRPDVIMNGLKLFEFRVQHTRKHSLLTWRDSCLLMPIALDGLKRTFNLDCDDKPFFPYAYNKNLKKENYSVRLPHLPAKNNYCPGSMKRDKHQQFEKWYAQNVQNSFYLREELKKYCQNDTEILLKAIVEFRRILMTEVTDGYDVLPLSCTIASACMNIFRGIFMEEDQLALVPEAGYERNDRASVFAIKYLDWRSKTEGVQIQHAGNGREKQWKKYKLDGWIEEQNKCIEVLGCYWHGCEHCFSPEDLLVDGKSCRELNVATYDRLLQIREPDDDGQCIEVEEVWECEINAQLTKNAEMRTFFDDLGNERGPIDPRTAYCGGRTGPLRLFAEPEADEKISVFDIVSLYPWVNYTTEYPVGIPQIIRPEHDEMFVNWTRPDDLKYRGIYRVRIVPHRGLRIPVLPVKIDERLLFCCCHHCASAFRKRGTCVQHKCPHSDAQRSFTGNYTHIELERALESGYRIDRFWRAWHYEEWSDQIFKEYVRLLIKLKVQASGFPDGVTTDQQIMSFAAEYKRIYDVSLNVKQIKKNPGLRFITKLMLNSLWGKFSMRNELGANKVITRPQEFFKLVFDHKVEISSVIPLSDDAIRVLYKHKRNFVTEHSSSNIVLSLWTTSRARLKLLDYMQQIDRTEGAHLLYTDTDSVTVMHKKDLVPIKTGQYLGEMSEEYTNYDIRTFVCGGAKQYAFRMLDKLTGNEEFVQKIRGITFDVENSKALQFHHFRQQVLNYAKNNDDDSCGALANVQEDERNCPAIFRYSKIQPMRDSKVITRQQCKRYLPVCQKGIITNDLNVLPFGFE